MTIVRAKNTETNETFTITSFEFPSLSKCNSCHQIIMRAVVILQGLCEGITDFDSIEVIAR